MTEPEKLKSSNDRGAASPLRFGIMCKSLVFQRWQAEALKELSEHGHRPVLLIMDARVTPETSRFKNILKKKTGTLLYTFLENRVFKPGSKRLVDLRDELQGVPALFCIVCRRGYREYFPEADLDIIRQHRLDFILRFGFNIIGGEILHAARFGVWSFHHDDEMKYRGGPPGFWEIFNGDPVSGSVLQQLTDKLDGGIILKKGFLKTVMHSYKGNLDQLLSVSSSWPAMVADEYAWKKRVADDEAGNDQDDRPASKTKAPVFKVPGNLQMLKFIWLLLRNRSRFHWKDLVAAEFWNAGLIRKPIHEIALGRDSIRETDISWLPPAKKSGYFADPGGFMKDGRLHILVEEYSYVSQKACIAEMIIGTDTVGALDPGRVQGPGRVIEGDGHLSYPYIIEHGGNIYCLPESYQSSGIALYRRDPLTGKFTKSHTLVEHIEAVDPTLLFYNGMWWLFFTIRKYSNTHLFLYHARELTGEFRPHRRNPVKTDIRSARPAGTPFIHEHVLYRPAQDCSGTYGGRIAINRVLRLDTVDFQEETVNFIGPVQGSRYSKGFHTISAAGNFTLIDGKRYGLNPCFFGRQLRKKLFRKDPGNV